MRLEAKFALSSPFVTAAVIVTPPAATPIASQPASAVLTVAIAAFDEAQSQLAVASAAPPDMLMAKTAALPTAISADSGAIEATNGGGGGGAVTVRLEAKFALSSPFVTAAVIVTPPAATPVASQPASAVLTVAIATSDEVQTQLAAASAAPPEELTAKTMAIPTATVADPGAIEAENGA